MALFCSQCGVENHQDAVTCYHCQSPIARPAYGAGGQHGGQTGAPQGGQTGAPQGYYEETVRDATYSRMDDEPFYEETSNQKPRFQLRMGSLVIGAVCVLYLLNPTAGFIEFIPDNIPIIGNLDEAAAVTGLLMALSNLGIIPYKRN